MVLLAGAQTAWAQSTVKLVSNTGQPEQSSVSFSLTYDRAVGFTTGSNSAGYVLKSVDLDLSITTPSNTTDPTYTVDIYSDSSNNPDSSLATLTNPASLNAGINSFTSSDGINLASDTTYYVVLDVTATGNRGVRMQATRSNDEDTNTDPAAAGWSIADGNHRRSGGSWTIPDPITSKLAVHGYAKAAARPPPPDRRPKPAEPIGEQSAPVRTALEIDLSEAFKDPQGQRLRYAAVSSDPRVALASVDGEVLTVRGIDSGAAEMTVTATNSLGLSASQRFMVTVEGPEAVWYLPPAMEGLAQGFVRVVNHSDVAGEATVTATDDAGVRYAPLTLALGPRQARAFNAEDLEGGNPEKGLAGATGAGTGGWRLDIDSEALDVEALAYARSADGLLTALGATSAVRADGAREVALFHPGSSLAQVSRLRLVNAWAEDVEATVTGVDDTGHSPGEPVHLTVPAGTSCTVDAAQLESGTGLACGLAQEGLGDGSGKWRLTVASEPPLVAMSVASSPSGHLVNLSEDAAADGEGVWRVPLFPSASNPHARQGIVRVVNRSDRAGEVTIQAFDDGDMEYEPLVLALDAGETVHLSSDDLELGSPAEGLTDGTGEGEGTWRLALSSEGLELEAHAYVLHADGLLTPMQAPVPESGGVHRVVFFNPGGNARQMSVLRLVNPGDEDARVRITGADDTGWRPGTTVGVVVPGAEAVELSAAELESGESEHIDAGALGEGSGKWRLRVEADGEVAVMSVLSGSAGHLANLSHADRWRGYERAPAVLLPPPETVTLRAQGTVGGLLALRGRWSAVPGARYAVDLLRDGVRQEHRSLEGASRTTFRWLVRFAGTYTIRACSVNEDGECGAWSAESDAVVIH